MGNSDCGCLLNAYSKYVSAFINESRFQFQTPKGNSIYQLHVILAKILYSP